MSVKVLIIGWDDVCESGVRAEQQAQFLGLRSLRPTSST